jgi:hypothetical protein
MAARFHRMIAINHIRPLPHYRRDAFDAGLRQAGYSIVKQGAPKSAEDLMVIWNRYGGAHQMANQWEASGGTVLVCENGYIGKDAEGRQHYAIAAHGHNGSGWWPVGAEDRFSALGVDVLPWVNRPDGYALICGQRGIGSPTMASPPNWHIGAQKRVKAFHPNTKLRLHPGNKAPAVPLEQDLAGAAWCVIWSSSSGVRALCLGVPVIFDAPHWICEGAAMRLGAGGGTFPTDEQRAQALHRMAWAQYSVAEIESGEPFVRFRSLIAERQKAAA